MKPITQSLIAGLAGALIATVLIFAFNRPWISDETGDDAESAQKENNIKEQIYACFKERHISYEEMDSIATNFTYHKENYWFLYDSVEDSKYLRIWTDISLSDGENPVPFDVLQNMYENALSVQYNVKYVMISAKGEHIRLFVEQYVDPDMDIKSMIACMVEVLEYSRDLCLADSYYDDEESGSDNG